MAIEWLSSGHRVAIEWLSNGCQWLGRMHPSTPLSIVPSRASSSEAGSGRPLGPAWASQHRQHRRSHLISKLLRFPPLHYFASSPLYLEHSPSTMMPRYVNLFHKYVPQISVCPLPCEIREDVFALRLMDEILHHFHDEPIVG